MEKQRKRSPVLQRILDKLNEEKMKKNDMFEECLKSVDPQVKEEVDRNIANAIKRQEAIDAIVDFIYENMSEYEILQDSTTISIQTYKTSKDKYAISDVGLKFQTIGNCRDNWVNLINDIYNALLKKCNKKE